MAGVSFDDLIPQSKPQALPAQPSFSDLIPAQQMGGATRLPAMAASNLAKGALEGVGSLGSLDDLLHSMFTAGLYNPLHQAVTGRPATRALAAAGSSDPLSSAALTGYAKQAGVVDRPDLQPQTTAERYLAAGAEGAGSMLPFAPMATGGVVANALRAATQGAGAGLGGEAAASMFPNHPTLARLAGSLAGAVGGGAAFNAANRVAGAVGGASTPTLDAYRNLGLEPTLAGDVTGSPTMQMIQAYAAKAPGGANRIHSASEDAVTRWGNALENLAGDMSGAPSGGARTLQQAGEALQTNGKAWLQQFKNDSARAWGNVDVQIPANTPVGLQNYGTTLADVINQMPNAPATAKQLQPALSRNLLGSLLKDTQKGPLTWQDVKGIRTRIGEKLAEPQLVGDTSYTDLKRLYGALTDDLQATAAARGPAAQAAFDQANTLTREGHGFIEDVLSKVLKGNRIAPERAAAAALNSGASGGTLLDQLRAQMPQGADELAAYKLRDMALANAGQQNAAATRLSPGTFVTENAKLSPEAVSALFQNDPRLADLATVAGSMKNTERFLNTSNTGAHGATAHAMAGFGAAVPAAIEAYHLGGFPAATAAALSAIAAPYLPSYLASRISTSPALTRLMASPAAADVGAPLLNRAAIAQPVLRALTSGGAGRP